MCLPRLSGSEPILLKGRNGVFLFNRLIEKCVMTREMIILIEEYNLNSLSLRRGTVVFQPPPKNRVPHLMKDFALWLNSDQAHELYPVLLSGISHYEFVRIHPFVDGNGRTARALATLILYLKSFDTKRFFALDDYYNEDRERDIMLCCKQ